MQINYVFITEQYQANNVEEPGCEFSITFVLGHAFINLSSGDSVQVALASKYAFLRSRMPFPLLIGSVFTSFYV